MATTTNTFSMSDTVSASYQRATKFIDAFRRSVGGKVGFQLGDAKTSGYQVTAEASFALESTTSREEAEQYTVTKSRTSSFTTSSTGASVALVALPMGWF